MHKTKADALSGIRSVGIVITIGFSPSIFFMIGSIKAKLSVDDAKLAHEYYLIISLVLQYRYTTIFLFIFLEFRERESKFEAG